jgi:CubicO group peptidase (beta-lactamase class C family)
MNEWETNLIKALPETSFRSKPGERFRYSNIGFAILGLTLSKIEDKPFIELVQEKILIPLEMNTTYFKVPDNQKENVAIGMAGGPTAELDFERPRREHNEVGYSLAKRYTPSCSHPYTCPNSRFIIIISLKSTLFIRNLKC